MDNLLEKLKTSVSDEAGDRCFKVGEELSADSASHP
jgi:hypothetical protein